MPHAWDTPAWAAVEAHAREARTAWPPLSELVLREDRARALTKTFHGTILDASRSAWNPETLDLLVKLAEAVDVPGRVRRMVAGSTETNVTERRAVLHTALRAAPGSTRFAPDVVASVREVLARVYDFAGRVRSGAWTGCTGKPLVNVVSIGIGGSYLGPEFVHEALRFAPGGAEASRGRTLRFLANVDPVDVSRALADLDPEQTLVVVVSKTFTTAETMLNARTVKAWLEAKLGAKAQGGLPSVAARHIAAVSADVPKARAFGIDESNVLGFWDWVGGRYSVCSSVGAVPLALQYGERLFEEFLAGARAMDEHFFDAPLRENLPVVLGLLAVWNHTFLGHTTRAVLPYAQALLRFPAHVQQLSMESLGKRVTASGEPLPFPAGEIIFGEPGTNGQHSFYQLIHQGRVVPCDFIGVCRSQTPMRASDKEPVANHDELMSNFFAQPDALVKGKSAADLAREGVPSELVPHKTFTGNRPSVSILLPELDAARVGQLLALYENQVAVQGFVWGINAFDQFGVELGKVLANEVRGVLRAARDEKRVKVADAEAKAMLPATRALIEAYLAASGE